MYNASLDFSCSLVTVPWTCVQANVWIAIFSFIGNYFWTHYFYKILGATYTFPAHRLNDVRTIDAVGIDSVALLCLARHLECCEGFDYLIALHFFFFIV